MTSQRADAAARRTLILDAADHVFGQYGVNAPLEQVVERAEVGRATLYRNFRDRASLMQALLERAVDRLRRRAAELQDRDDALFELLAALAQRAVDSPALSDHWRAIPAEDPQLKAARAEVRALFEQPIRRAIAAGLCRPDLLSSDVPLISGMLGAALRGKSGHERAALADRAMQLLRGGLQGPERTEG